MFKLERHLYVWQGIKLVRFVLPLDWHFSLSRSELLWKSPSLPERWNLYEYRTRWISLCLPRWLLWKELRNWYFWILHVSSEIWNCFRHGYVLVSQVAFLYAHCWFYFSRGAVFSFPKASLVTERGSVKSDGMQLVLSTWLLLCVSVGICQLSLLSSVLGWLFKKPLKTIEMLQQFPLDLDKTENISFLWFLCFFNPNMQLGYSLMEMGYRCSFPCYLSPCYPFSCLLACLQICILYKLGTKEGGSDERFSFNCGVGFWPDF